MRRLIAMLLAAALCLGAVEVEPVQAAAAVVEEDPIVIVLDPGHGGFDGGATRTWSGKTYREKTLNLAIAKYCKEELEKYTGVEVYLTRPGDTFVTLEGRVIFAEKKNADLFVSLHNNADIRSSSKGACVFYPNANYDEEMNRQGKGVADSILKELTKLGLKNLGTNYRNSQTRSQYPDKSLADYYRVIKQSKLCGFPGIIVEHAYVSNPGDCKSYLSTNAKLKKLGVADAKGIANYFGLVKGRPTTLTDAKNQSDGSVLLTWEEAKGMDGYAVYRRENGASEFTQITTVQGGNSTRYVDATVEGGITYEYCIRPYVACAKTSRCEEASNVMQATSLAAPQKLTGKQMTSGRVKLSWSPVKGASGYYVSRRANAAESYTVVADIGSGTTLAWEDTKSLSSGNYEYQVCAYVKNAAAVITGPYAPVVQVAMGADAGVMLGAGSENDIASEDFQYRVEGERVTIVSYEGIAGAVVIPEELDGMPVAAIAERAFYDCYWVESVIVPAEVSQIGDEAFAECSSLSSLVLQCSSVVFGSNVLAECQNVTVWGCDASGAESFAVGAGVPYEKIISTEVYYELDGGTNSSKNPAHYNNYDGMIPLQNPKLSGYKFDGWYMDAAYTQPVTELSASTAAGDSLTLYALWYQTPGKVKVKKAVSKKKGQIKVSWSARSDADGYVIYRRFRGGTWKAVATVGKNKTSYTDKDVVSEMTYCYTIKAYTKVGKKKYYGSYDTDGVNVECK